MQRTVTMIGRQKPNFNAYNIQCVKDLMKVNVIALHLLKMLWSQHLNVKFWSIFTALYADKAANRRIDGLHPWTSQTSQIWMSMPTHTYNQGSESFTLLHLKAFKWSQQGSHTCNYACMLASHLLLHVYVQQHQQEVKQPFERHIYLP